MILKDGNAQKQLMQKIQLCNTYRKENKENEVIVTETDIQLKPIRNRINSIGYS